MQVAIFYNPKTNPQNKLYALEVVASLKKSGLKYTMNPASTEFRNIEIAITVGGDGTVLYTANLLSKTKIPILGINFGHRGYLCKTSRENIESAIKKIIAKEYRIEEKTRIQAKIVKQKKTEVILEALNEISIGGINRTVHIGVEIVTSERKIAAEISGDGIIIATRTGSTAYNINAGGPILLTEAFSIVANNAFFESDYLLPITKSMIVSTETIIKIHDLSHNPANLPYVIADGQKSTEIKSDDLILIEKAKNKNYFIMF